MRSKIIIVEVTIQVKLNNIVGIMGRKNNLSYIVFLRTVRETPLRTIADELYFLYALRTSTVAGGGGCGWIASLHILLNI